MKTCRDCKQPLQKHRSIDAIESGRCDECQIDRDEYYSQKMKNEHYGESRQTSERAEHGTYHTRNGKA